MTNVSFDTCDNLEYVITKDLEIRKELGKRYTIYIFRNYIPQETRVKTLGSVPTQ